MGRKKEKKESEKWDDDPLLKIYCERIAAADAAAAAAATNTAAAAAAPAAISPIATDTDTLPPVILEGRFKGYVSPSRVAWEKREQYKWYASQAREDFAYWQEEVADELSVHVMCRHKMLNEIRSTRTDAPSQTAAAAAAADTSVVAAAAAAATAATAATTNAAATAAAE